MKNVTFCTLAGIALLSGCSKKSNSSSTGSTGTTDSATVTVVNGYGSGKYKVGDTVNIWSQAIPANMVFDTWSGYSELLQDVGEWHNSFVMPAQDVSVTASQKSLTPFTLTYEKIRGVNILKNVYYYFPAGHIGIAYLLHGTGGSAQTLVNQFEWTQTINDLVSAGYAIVVTEAEEVSLNQDLNGDGYIRWDIAPLDTSTNVDYGNFRVLTDTFYARGYTAPSIPRYSIGMSDGGAFSAALSYLYKYAAGVSYCAPTNTQVTGSSTTPFQFCMAKYDNNAEVGSTGDATAQSNSSALTTRGICSKFYLHDHSPVYPQRFARRSDISLTLSASLYNELATNHWLDSKNYLTAASDTISARITANPSAYPFAKSLTTAQFEFYTDQLDCMYAAHMYFSDWDKMTISFLQEPCQHQ